MYEVIDTADTGKGNFGVRWIGGEVLEYHQSKRQAARQRNRLNAEIEGKAIGRVTRRRRVKKG